MARKRYSAEQIIGYLREAEVLLAKGSDLPQLVVPLFKLVFPPSRAV